MCQALVSGEQCTQPTGLTAPSAHVPSVRQVCPGRHSCSLALEASERRLLGGSDFHTHEDRRGCEAVQAGLLQKESIPGREKRKTAKVPSFDPGCRSQATKK